jgi:glycosyltransferase involved in cell wall biosynthesis
MKIAMIGQKGIPTQYGGIEKHVEALAVRLGAAGHDVTVYTRRWYAAPRARFSRGVRTVAVPTVQSKHLDAIVHTFFASLHALKSRADIYHYHGVGPALLSWMPRLFAPRAKVVVTFHCIDRKHQKWGMFARLMLGIGERAAALFPHETITVSRTLQSYVRDRYDRDARYIPNGIDTPPARIGTDLLKRWSLTRGGYVVMVSRLVRHKGAHHLIRAYADLRRRGAHAGKKLVIVGDSAFTDDYVRELRALAEGIPGVVFTGYLQGRALQQVFAGAFAVVHPSESEGLPIAVLEAMAYGKCVLASDIPENMEVIRQHGMSFRNKSVPDLSRKLRALLSSPWLAAEIGAKAKDYVLEQYHWDDVATETDRLYAEKAPDRTVNLTLTKKTLKA